MKARVTVTLKPSVLDPQGKAIAGALASLGIDGIASVRQGKLFDLELADGDPGAARAALEQACIRLLANTVVENFQVELDISAAAEAQPAGSAAVVEPQPQLAETTAPASAPVAVTASIPAAEPDPPPPQAGAPRPEKAEVPPSGPAAPLDPSAATEIAARDAEMPTEGHP